MKKVFVLIGLLFILTGCTGKYNINIKSNGKVEEKFEMTFDNSIVQTNNIDLYFKETVEEYRKNNMYKSYKITKDSNKNKSTIYVSRTFNSMNELIEKSEILPIIFEKSLPNGEYGEYGIVTTGNYYKSSIFEGDFDGEPFEKIDIYVKSQNKMVSNNADSYDNDSNTLYWLLTNEKNNFSLDFKFNNSKRYDIIIKDIIKDYWSIAVIIVSIIIVITVIVKILKKQNKMNNEI